MAKRKKVQKPRLALTEDQSRWIRVFFGPSDETYTEEGGKEDGTGR